MKEYLRWSLWQLYLVFFWPSRFWREVEGYGTSPLSDSQRFRYMVRMLPVMLAIAGFVNLVVGVNYHWLGLEFSWISSAFAVAYGVVFSVAVGVTLGVGGGMEGGVGGRVSSIIAYFRLRIAGCATSTCCVTWRSAGSPTTSPGAPSPTSWRRSTRSSCRTARPG